MKILFWLRIVKPVGKDGHKFNIYNPVAWLMLIICAIGVGIIDGVSSFYNFIAQVVKDASS